MFEKLVKIAIKIPPLRLLLEKLVNRLLRGEDDEKNFGCSRWHLYNDD